MSENDEFENDSFSPEEDEEEEYEYDYSDEDEMMDQHQQQAGDDDASMSNLERDEEKEKDEKCKHNKKPRSSSLTSDNPNAAPVKGFHGREENDGDGGSYFIGTSEPCIVLPLLRSF